MAYLSCFSIKVSKHLKCELLNDYVRVKRGLMLLSMHRTRLCHVFSLMSAALLGGEPASWGRQRRASRWSGCGGSQNPEVIFIRKLSGAPCSGHRCQSSGDRKGNLPSSWILLVSFLHLWRVYKRTYQEYFLPVAPCICKHVAFIVLISSWKFFYKCQLDASRAYTLAKGLVHMVVDCSYSHLFFIYYFIG